MASEIYKGKDLDIAFDGHKCIHSRNCVLSFTRVFKGGVEGPWIDPDAAPAEDIAAAIRSCPSNALTYTRKDGKPGEQAPDVNRAQIMENGPIAVRGDLELDGKPIGFRAVLCRCGASKHKPFCDHSHADADFKATGEPATQATIQALAERGGKLKLEPQKDGPLKVEGNLEITAGTGRRVNMTRTAYLCRCGHSANKPYCDGTHKKTGFTADGA